MKKVLSLTVASSADLARGRGQGFLFSEDAHSVFRLLHWAFKSHSKAKLKSQKTCHFNTTLGI